MSLPELCLRRPVATITFLVAATVLGVVSVARLPLEYLPEIQGRHLRISVPYPSSSPREIERIIARPLEEELASLQGLESLSTTAQATGATLRIELHEDADVDDAALEVRERIDRARPFMPEDVGRIEVRRWRSTDRPILRFRVARAEGTSRATLERFIDEVLVPRLSRLPGVGNVEERGLNRTRVVVDLDRERLAQAGLTASGLGRILRTRNRNVSAGLLRSSDKVLSIRILGELGNAEAVASLPIGAGRLLGDVADVREEVPPLERVTRLDGQEAITFRVSKESGANSVEVCLAVEQELLRIEELPLARGFQIKVYRNDRERILARLNNLRQSGIYGGVLLCAVLLLFLRRLAPTFIVALTIPLSVVLTFGILFISRQLGAPITLNVVSMMGLILGIGLVVDNGIVVLENITRLREQGVPAREAAGRGASEVSQAITASMITSLIVFVPLLMTNAMGSRWMRDLAFVVCASVFSSLWVALTAVPLLASVLLRERAPADPAAPAGETQASSSRLLRGYGWVLGGTIRVRWLVLLVVLPLCGWQIVHFFRTVERSWGGGEATREVEVKVLLPRAFTPQDRDSLFRQMEKVVLAHRDELDLARLTSAFRMRAEVQSRGRGGWRGGDSDRLELLLNDGPGKRASLGFVRRRLKELLPREAGVVYQLGAARRRGGGTRSVQVLVRGRSSQELVDPARRVAEVLRRVEGVEDIELGAELTAAGLEVRPSRRRGARFGVPPRDVGRAVAATLGERAVTRLRGRTRELDVILRLRDEDRASVRDLRRTAVPRTGSAARPMAVESLASIRQVPSPRQIQRIDRMAVSTVTASVLEGHEVRTVTGRVERALGQFSFPRGVSFELGGRVRRWRKGESQNVGAVLLSFVLVLILLAALFESYLDAVLIAVTVPFALVGVAWAFWLTDTKMSNVAWIGLMILIGIVVNHGIVLVDRVRRLLGPLERGPSRESRREALIAAGRDRMRPIVMTAATTVLGLLPIVAQHQFPQVFRSDSGAQMYGPIGLAVASGLVVSTALTLLVLPALLSVGLDLRVWLLRQRKRVTP